MPRQIYVSLLPGLIDASRLTGSMAVVIDVLRASTTASAALAGGARRVVPLATVDDARRIADRFEKQGERPLLGGERSGKKIDGFDLGNSPLEYTPESVSGRTIIFTTTNGTRALLAAGEADWIGMAAFANLSATTERLASGSGDVHLICAGTDGQVTFEDVLAAGAIAGDLRDRLGRDAIEPGNDQTKIALAIAGRYGTLEQRLEEMESSLGGRNLVNLGYRADIERCAEIDSLSVVPVLQKGALVLEAREVPSDDMDWSI